MMIIAWAIIARTQQDEKKKRCFLCLKDEVSTIPEMHLKASQLLHCDRNPDEDEANEELEGEGDDALHRHRDRNQRSTYLSHNPVQKSRRAQLFLAPVSGNRHSPCILRASGSASHSTWPLNDNSLNEWCPRSATMCRTTWW